MSTKLFREAPRHAVSPRFWASASLTACLNNPPNPQLRCPLAPAVCKRRAQFVASINVFPSCRMRAFAAMVTREFGVQVRMRGREICVRLSKPPVIFLPNLEYAREEDLLPIYGFCLHEAAHIAYTNPKVGARAPNYLLKIIWNTI